jgi:hypothetical protein
VAVGVTHDHGAVEVDDQLVGHPAVTAEDALPGQLVLDHRHRHVGRS